MQTSPDALSPDSLYKLLTGTVLPRPIAWVSTLSAEGIPNLAPFSYFNIASANPPFLLFCPTIRGTDSAEKDTLLNIRATGDFVINIVTEPLAEAMNLTSGEYPSQVDEFRLAALTTAPSQIVKTPRVAESPVNFECTLHQIITLSDAPGGGSIVIGRVVYIHIDESVLFSGDKIALSALQPIGKLAGSGYTRTRDTFDLQRPSSQITPKPR